MSRKLIQADLVRWSQDRLDTWVDDNLMRYQAIDLPLHDAWGDIIANLIALTAGLVAV
jgi:hypothetical protein